MFTFFSSQSKLRHPKKKRVSLVCFSYGFSLPHKTRVEANFSNESFINHLLQASSEAANNFSVLNFDLLLPHLTLLFISLKLSLNVRNMASRPCFEIVDVGKFNLCNPVL